MLCPSLMSPTPPRPQPANATCGLFVTTRWSVVTAARDPTCGASRQALETLCSAYWYPLYAFVRRLGNSPHDAQDLTQEFFARLLEKEWLGAADRDRGRFRSFLMMAMKRFLANEWDKRRAGKRGGGVATISLDTEYAEARYLAEPASDSPADHLYERRWALTLLDQAMARLRGEYEQAGRNGEFERLKEFLTAARGEIPYDRIASEQNGSEGAARVAVHRLRKRFREIFRATIADTVSSGEEVEAEVRYVAEILGRG
jgi:RNA polymerase sigma factor (sigma-70 family)